MANRIIFTEPGVTLLQPFDVRDPGPTDVVIETAFSLMSIGTELTILHRRYADNSHFARIFSFPQLKTGVQASGRVIATGEDVENVQTGDRVFVRMAHGSHQVCDESECTPIPESVNLDDACWCGLGKTAFRAAWLAESGDESRVLVVGAGPLGQMLVRWLLAMKKDVIVADMSAQRLDYANAAGNVRTVAGDLHDSLATLKHSNSDGFPMVIDTTGNAAVFALALEAAANYGKVILLGDTGYPEKQHLTSAMMSKGLTVRAVHDSHDIDDWTEQRVNKRFFELVANGRMSLEGLISHRFSPLQHEEAYETADRNRSKTMGVLFDWGDVEF